MRRRPANFLVTLLAISLVGLFAPSPASAASNGNQNAGRKPPPQRSHTDWLQQAQVLEQNENWEALLDWGVKWADSEPRSALARYVQGRALGALKRFPEAIGAYLHALRFDPNDVNALNNLGNAYRQIGQFQDALLSYREALRLNPDFLRAWHNIGVTYYGLKGQAGLAEAIKEAEGINPEIAMAWQDLFIKYSRTRDESSAMEAVRTLGRQNPDDLDRLFNILLSRLDH